MKPSITYDDEVDVLGIWIREGQVDHTIDCAPGIMATVDENGELLYLEILDARGRIDNTAFLDTATERTEAATA